MKILAIDPGNTQSAFVFYDAENKKVLSFGKYINNELIQAVNNFNPDVVLIEMVACYGMPVGKEVFDTAVWIGRFLQRLIHKVPRLVYRKDVKLHHCNSVRAKDGNIIQALKDKYGDKGTMKAPGFFYGFAADVWQAFAIAAMYAEQQEKKTTFGIK